MQIKLRTLVSWLVTVVGFFVGLFALANFGMAWVPLGDHDAAWLLGWLGFAGVGLLALGFLVGSLVAVRHPTRAGIIFLCFLPITAFCLGYPGSGFLVWHADGGGWFESPLPLTAVALTALFFLPFVAPLFTLRHRKRAAAVFAAAALVAVPVFIHSRWTTVLLPRLLGYSAPFLLFGLFWLGTRKVGWPSLLPPRVSGVVGRIAASIITGLVVLCVDVALTLALTVRGASLFSGDCRRNPPFTRPQSSRHAVFTARVIFVGRSNEALISRQGIHSGYAGNWAIGVVQERFWGLPWWEPHVVLLTNFIYREGETYFIDGSREYGLLTQRLPIVGAGIGCSRSQLVQDAVADLRSLREAR